VFDDQVAEKISKKEEYFISTAGVSYMHLSQSEFLSRIPTLIREAPPRYNPHFSKRYKQIIQNYSLDATEVKIIIKIANKRTFHNFPKLSEERTYRFSHNSHRTIKISDEIDLIKKNNII
jgi:hypothetical protein